MISFGDCIVQHTTQNMHIFSDLSQHVQFFMSVVCLLACAYIHEVVHVCMFSVTWHRSSNWEMSLALGGERVLSGSRVWTSSKRHATSAWFASFSFIWAWSNKPSTLLTYTHTHTHTKRKHNLWFKCLSRTAKQNNASMEQFMFSEVCQQTKKSLHHLGWACRLKPWGCCSGSRGPQSTAAPQMCPLPVISFLCSASSPAVAVSQTSHM